MLTFDAILFILFSLYLLIFYYFMGQCGPISWTKLFESLLICLKWQVMQNFLERHKTKYKETQNSYNVKLNNFKETKYTSRESKELPSNAKQLQRYTKQHQIGAKECQSKAKWLGYKRCKLTIKIVWNNHKSALFLSLFQSRTPPTKLAVEALGSLDRMLIWAFIDFHKQASSHTHENIPVKFASLEAKLADMVTFFYILCLFCTTLWWPKCYYLVSMCHSNLLHVHTLQQKKELFFVLIFCKFFLSFCIILAEY